MRVKAVNEIGPEARKRVAPAVRRLLRKCREAIPALLRRGLRRFVSLFSFPVNALTRREFLL
jgi:hypothetical protein